MSNWYQLLCEVHSTLNHIKDDVDRINRKTDELNDLSKKLERAIEVKEEHRFFKKIMEFMIHHKISQLILFLTFSATIGDNIYLWRK